MHGFLGADQRGSEPPAGSRLLPASWPDVAQRSHAVLGLLVRVDQQKAVCCELTDAVPCPSFPPCRPQNNTPKSRLRVTGTNKRCGDACADPRTSTPLPFLGHAGGGRKAELLQSFMLPRQRACFVASKGMVSFLGRCCGIPMHPGRCRRCADIERSHQGQTSSDGGPGLTTNTRSSGLWT
jgi:hypothetical protein